MDYQVSQVAPWLQNAGAAAGIAGTGLSAYGNLVASRQAQGQYEMALAAWREEQERQKRMDAQAEQQRQINNTLNAGQYATGQINDTEDPYIAYARQLGL
jgi:hypothetical protein